MSKKSVENKNKILKDLQRLLELGGTDADLFLLDKIAESTELASVLTKIKTIDGTDGVGVEQIVRVGDSLVFNLTDGTKIDFGSIKGDKGDDAVITKKLVKDIVKQVEDRLPEPVPGDKGDKGDTPVAGEDYFTAEEREEMIADTAFTVETQIPPIVEEYVKEEVDKIEFPEVSGIDITEKLEDLEGEQRLDATAIKNLPAATVYGGKTSVQFMNDVDPTGLTDGYVLTWNSTKSKFDLQEGGGSGGGTWGSITGTITDQTDLVAYVASQVSAETLAEVSTNSTNNTESLYTMKVGVDVEFQASAGATLFRLDNDTEQAFFNDGTSTYPAIAFHNDENTGFFNVSDGIMGYSGNGTQRFNFNTLGITSTGSGFHMARNDSVSVPSYSFNGDTNTGMYHPAADELGWSLGGSNAMILDSVGLGVGTAGVSPVNPFQVIGGTTGLPNTSGPLSTGVMTFTNGSAGDSSAAFGRVGGSSNVWFQVANIANMAIAKGDMMLQPRGGMVSIGRTTDADYKLDVYDDGSNGATMRLGGDANGYVDASILFESNNASAGRGGGSYYHNQFGDYEWYWGRAYNNDNFIVNRNSTAASHEYGTADINQADVSNFLTIEGLDGFVGLHGVTNPTQPLHITSKNEYYIKLDQTGSGSPVGIQFDYTPDNNQSYFAWEGSANVQVLNDGSNRLFSWAYKRHRFGLGTHSPTHQIHSVMLKEDPMAMYFDYTSTGTFWSLEAGDGSSTDSRDWFINMGGHGGSIFTADLRDGIFISSGDQVGIGTFRYSGSTVDARLHVNSGTTNNVAKFESTDSIAVIQLTDDGGSAYMSTGSSGRCAFGPTSGIASTNVNVNTNGTVAIGTTFTSSRLEVRDSSLTQATFAYDASNKLDIDINSSGHVTYDASGSIHYFYCNGGEEFRITNSYFGAMAVTRGAQMRAGSVGVSNVAYGFVGTADTGFLSDVDDEIATVIAGTVKTRLTATGLGIGVTADAQLGLDNAAEAALHTYGYATDQSIFNSYFNSGDDFNRTLDIAVASNDRKGAIRFMTSDTNSTDPTTRMEITHEGNVSLGAKAAVATTATDGFTYITTCAGTPTGTPTTVAGQLPMVIDSTNDKMYIYSSGAWVALN